MIKTIHWKNISGTLAAPSSKSVAQRVLALAAMATGRSTIRYAGNSDDVRAAVGVCRQLGARITETENNVLVVEGGIQIPVEPLHCGESGLGIRMFSAVAGILSDAVTLTGEGSLASRPMNMIEDSLRAAGVFCDTREGFIPVVVKGPYPGGDIHVDGSVSSQVLTGLLMASPFAGKTSRFNVKDLKSKPYIDITIQVMGSFGVEVINKNYEVFEVPATGKYSPCVYNVEGDWSGASFPLVAGAIGGQVTVKNLNMNSTQADRAILAALVQCGASVLSGEDFLEVRKSDLKAFDFDATDCPDLFPPLVALAAACEGVTYIKGVSRLKVKESDRALALKTEFGKLGLNIALNGDTMEVHGGRLKGGSVFSHHDHRIAMACAVASLISGQPIIIDQAQAVAKSYPDFYSDMEKIAVS